jgi:ABC-2 type transport system ATP-binding protein
MFTDVAIQTQDLTFHFGDIQAVSALTLTIHSGEVFGLLGHNGAGKTTTIRLLNGLLYPLSGSAQVLGKDTVRDGVTIRQQTGVLTETPSLDERLTGRDNLTIYANIFGVRPAEIADRVQQLLTDFDLAGRADEKVSDYSKGMKQRLALARALIHQPQILFLDEPTSALDPLAARQVHALIRRLSREEGRTVMLCTHNLVEAAALCDRVAMLYQGRLLIEGEPAGLSAQLDHASRLTLETTPEASAQLEALLADWPGSLAVQPEGAAGFLSLSGLPRDQIPALLKTITVAGIPLYRAVPAEATLADVYFALHEGNEGHQ